MKHAKIILAIALVLCFADMPYGYYNLIRYASCIIFGLMAYIENKDKNMPKFILYAAIAILFQPFIKIALGRDLWNFIDIIAAIILVAPTIKQYFQR